MVCGAPVIGAGHGMIPEVLGDEKIFFALVDAGDLREKIRPPSSTLSGFRPSPRSGGSEPYVYSQASGRSPQSLESMRECPAAQIGLEPGKTIEGRHFGYISPPPPPMRTG